MSIVKKLFTIFAPFVFAFSSLAMLAPSLSVQAADLGNSIKCQEYSQQVKLNPADTTTYKVVGTLCYHGAFENKPLQLLIAGATYNSYLWDSPLQPETYSYVRAATAAGYVTYNVDRIGAGKSDIPDGLLVGITDTTFTIHQVAQSLRDGSLTGYKFNKIIAVGHSMGSGVSIQLGAFYPGDVDGIILGGYSHFFNPGLVAILGGDFYPANFDPKFANNPNDAHYMTTVPGKRAEMFFNVTNADPALITMDENLKDTVPFKAMSEIPVAILAPYSNLVNVPVLIVTGQEDVLACDSTKVAIDCTSQTAFAAFEAPHWSPAAQLETYTVPNSGHSFMFHKNAQETFAKMLDWTDRHFGHGED